MPELIHNHGATVSDEFPVLWSMMLQSRHNLEECLPAHIYELATQETNPLGAQVEKVLGDIAGAAPGGPLAAGSETDVDGPSTADVGSMAEFMELTMFPWSFPPSRVTPSSTRAHVIFWGGDTRMEW